MSYTRINIDPYIREMISFDLEPVIAIEAESYEFPWTIGILSDCLRVGYKCFVYEVDGEIRGYAIISFVLDEAHLLNICIAPQYQGKGYGYAFLDWLLHFAKESGAKTMYLEVRISNNRAINLYQAMGFNETGIRRNYYPAKSGKEDAQLLKPRKWANIVFAWIASVMWRKRGEYKATDPVNGFRGIMAESFRRMEIDATDCSIDYQMLIRAYKKNIKLIEFPTIEGSRIAGETEFKSIPTGIRELNMLLREIFKR